MLGSVSYELAASSSRRAGTLSLAGLDETLNPDVHVARLDVVEGRRRIEQSTVGGERAVLFPPPTSIDTLTINKGDLG
jgi:hypothetical protein